MNELPEGTLQLPPPLSTIAPEVDQTYMLIYWISMVFMVLITGAMLWFMWKYRRREGNKPKPTGHSTALEIAWTFSPLILLVYLFHEGFTGYMHGAIAPEDSVEIRVRGMQWNWEFEHRNGVIDELNVLKVPVGTPVQLIMSSSDVLHSFFIPTFRVKRDVVPGMYSTLWFQSDYLTDARPCTEDADCDEGHWCGGRIGQDNRTCALPAFCTEYCGAGAGITRSAFDDPDGEGRNTNHSTMMTDVRVITQEAYQRFINEGPPPPAACGTGDDIDEACWGEQIYQTSGCTACHSVDGVQQQPAPNWAGIWGNARPFTDGETRQGDAEYIKQSILQPQSQIVNGYAGVNMPPYRFSDKQLDAIVAYIRSLREGGGN